MIATAVSTLLKGADFRKACTEGECVEVALVEVVAVRDSKAGENSPVLWFSRTEWNEFMDGVRAGTFDFG